MSSDYPSKLDVFRRLENEYDELTAAQVNRLMSGIVNLQTELGTDPSNPGAAWPTYTNVKGLLEDLFRIEQGTFKVTVPQTNLYTNGVDIDFASTGRFDDADKLYVHVAYSGGPRVGENTRIGTIPNSQPSLGGVPNANPTMVYGDIGGISDYVNIRTSGSTPIGFTYRASIFRNTEEQEWEFWYLALQAP